MNTTADVRRVNAEELFKKYWPVVLRRCQDILGDTDAAVDVAQGVFVAILGKQNEYHATHEAGLLWRIATNNSLKELRNHANRRKAPDGETLLERIACSGDVEEEIASRNILQKLFARHPETSRTIAVLHLVDGMTLEETAQAMNMSVSGIRKRLRKLRKTLKELEDM
jgi:RNA polymerase sigma-70 factor (ECF subfamily)